MQHSVESLKNSNPIPGVDRCKLFLKHELQIDSDISGKGVFTSATLVPDQASPLIDVLVSHYMLEYFGGKP